MANVEKLLEIISDPYQGPYEGEDFQIDDQGIIQVEANNVKIAAKIMRLANSSGEFAHQLVNLGKKGDSILLGFDELAEQVSLYSASIGFKGDMSAEVKKDLDSKKFYIYLNGKRSGKKFSSLGRAKTHIKKLDAELKNTTELQESFDY